MKDHSIQNAYSEIIRNAEHFVYIENQFFITATGDQQAPIHNTIGRSIVEACVRAGKAGRKFRVIIVIPAIPGFAGDLRDDAAIGTRAIMDYQFKSICRGEHSIFEQIRKEGVDPTQHIFVFNLRSYDRLNKTPAMKKKEEESGVSYQDVQRAEAEEIMGTGIHGVGDEDMSLQKHDKKKGGGDDTSSEEQQKLTDAKRKFEEAGNNADSQHTNTSPSVAHHAMAGQGPVSEEKWEGKPEEEVENWIQEELYIHAKLLIVDDRIAICGSSNLVSHFLSPLIPDHGLWQGTSQANSRMKCTSEC